jgi:hypothetical protein
VPVPAQHLVSLLSVEDDALGEQLQVVWEIEPGAQVVEKVALPEPTGFDPPDRLGAFLDAVRWGAASTADLRNIPSPFRSGIDIEDYQLDPVVRAVQMPRVSLLITDDVGLGKTIASGLVVLELIIRHRARRVLVICPLAPDPVAGPLEREKRACWPSSSPGVLIHVNPKLLNIPGRISVGD